MKISLSWLLDIVNTELSPDLIAEALTMSGTEVNAIHKLGFSSEFVVVGEILSSQKHPQADRLSVCTVTVGRDSPPLQIVCGAKNYKVGDRVPVALPGAVLPGNIAITKSKLRGVFSEGMMCSAQELALPGSREGLLILDPGTELGKRVDSIFPNDHVFEIEVTSNRPDLLSHLGVARELVGLRVASWKGDPFRHDSIALNIGDEIKIAIEDAQFCPFYSATIFRGITSKITPSWMARRLESIGLRQINFLVDLTNYLLHHIGQPMHVFDLDKLSGNTVYIRKANYAETLTALDHNTYRLSEKCYVISDEKSALALAGIIGGESSSVTENTSNVLLEIARFSPHHVRKTARELHLSTDSSQRFERGINPQLQLAALKMAASIISRELNPASVCATLVDAQKEKDKKQPIPLRRQRVSQVLGVDLSEAEISSRLMSLGFESVSASHSPVTHWYTPSWRLDVHREADLIEELARTTDFEKIPPITTLVPASSSRHDLEHDFHNCIRHTLAGLGWYEVIIPPLTDQNGTGPTIANPMIWDHRRLRGSLLNQMCSILAHNIDAGNTPLRIFSIGKNFSADGVEKYHLALISAGPAHDENWLEKKRSLDVFDIKAVLAALGFSDQNVGYLGLSQIRKHGLKIPVAYAELPLGVPAIHNHKFTPWPAYPGSRRDVALVVGKTISASRIHSALIPPPTPLLDRTEIIDLYADPQGRQIPADCKTITISCSYRAADRTLTDDEIDSAHHLVTQRLLTIPGASLRV